MENDKKVDVVIPLVCDITGNFEELKYCLRSIDKNLKDVGNVYVLGPYKPIWLNNATFHYIGDPHKYNKDANIIDKILTAAKLFNLDDFLFWSDDQVIIQEAYLNNMPPVYNSRPAEAFDIATKNRWHIRVLNTFNYLNTLGIKLDHNYESHVPQRYNGKLLLDVMKDVDYTSNPGYTINTLFMGLLGIRGGIMQSSIKITSEGGYDSLSRLTDKILFYGYDTEGFKNVAKDKVSEWFPDKSKYEL